MSKRKLDNLTLNSQGISKGRLVPNITCKTINNKITDLFNLLEQNRFTVLILIDVNCQNCIHLLAYLKENTQKNHCNIRVLIVGRNEVLNFLEDEIRNYFDFYIISPDDAFRKLKVNAFPFGYFIDKNGAVLEKINIKNPQDIEVRIKSLVTGSA